MKSMNALEEVEFNFKQNCQFSHPVAGSIGEGGVFVKMKSLLLTIA
jgi:hypothetical protein